MKDILTHNWGTGQIELTNVRNEYKPVELHLKENGSLKDGPSLCIVMEKPHSLGIKDRVYGQVSVEMLNAALQELGYEIREI